MVKISLCMIVKNEEEVLERCLKSVEGIFDEIIIVDTGSTDRTKEIALGFTDKVFDYEWSEDFSAARNFSFSKAVMEYTAWLDADDVLIDYDRIGFLKLKEGLDETVDVVMMKYNVDFDESGNPNFFYYRERVVKNLPCFRFEGAVHEVIVPAGNIIYSDVAVTHKKLKVSEPSRNLRIYQNQLLTGKRLKPREQFYYGRELYYNNMYADAVKIFGKFLKDEKGWMENNIEACLFLSYCHYALGDNKKGLSALFDSLKYGIPRAEICCNIGKHFFDREEYKEAVFWYSLAITGASDGKNGAFIKKDYQDYIPYLQLCVCYYRLGEIRIAEIYNDKAGEIKPGDDKVQFNRDFFSSLTDQTPLTSV